MKKVLIAPIVCSLPGNEILTLIGLMIGMIVLLVELVRAGEETNQF